MDRELSLEELTTAAQQLSNGQTLGFDGLTADFYQHFRGLLGLDLHLVFMDSLKTKSCQPCDGAWLSPCCQRKEIWCH